MNQRKLENDPSYDPQLASHWQAESSIIYIYMSKNNLEKYQQKRRDIM